MGSQTVSTLAEQRGGISTNPGGLIPNPSTPIEQSPSPKQSSSDNLIRQIGILTTALDGINPISKPIQQKAAPIANDAGSPDEAIIEQRTAGTAKSSVRPTEPYDSPVLQLAFNNAVNLASDASVSKLVSQRLLSRDLNNNPVEQKPPVSNTVSVEQFNFLELVFPPCGSIKNPIDTNILWRIRDFGFPFVVSTLIFRVQGIEVQNSSNFTTTDIGGGLQLDYNPPSNFNFEEDVTVFLHIQDSDSPPNTFEVSCVFTTVPDTRPPVVSGLTLCGETNVSATAPVEFDIIDNGTGVDLSTFVFSIEGIPVCSGITISPLTTVSGNGYHVIWEHSRIPFKYGSNVTVAIEASDLAPIPNSSLFICSFDVEDSTPPDFLNFAPAPCDSFIDTDTGLTFEVYGNVNGVDISTLEVRVDNALRKVIVRPRVLRSE
jgi:hypothetical protein